MKKSILSKYMMQTLPRTSDVPSATFSALTEEEFVAKHAATSEIPLDVLSFLELYQRKNLQQLLHILQQNQRFRYMFLTIIASLDEKFVAVQSQLLHFIGLYSPNYVAKYTYLLHFLPLELHFLYLCHPIATFSRPVDTKYVAVLAFSFFVLLHFMYFSIVY